MKQCSKRNKATLEKCGKPFEGSGSYCKECRNAYQRAYYAERRDHPLRSGSAELGINCQCCGVGLRSNQLEIIEHAMLVKPMQLCGPCKATIKYASIDVDEETTEALLDAIMMISRITHAEAAANPVVRATVPDRYVPPTEILMTTRPRGTYVPPSAEEMAERAARNERLIEENLARGRAQAAAKAKELEAEAELAAKQARKEVLTALPLPDDDEPYRVARRKAEIEAVTGMDIEKFETPLTFDPTKPYVPVVLQSGNFVECGACEKEARPGKKFCEACKEWESG